MVFESITIKSGETLAKIGNDYGYNFGDWEKIWKHEANSKLRNIRNKPEKLLVGDKIILPLPWKIISKMQHVIPPPPRSIGTPCFNTTVKRSGLKGKNLRWVQTVFADNKSKYSTPYGVDLEADDDEPFYWNAGELRLEPHLRNTFEDEPWRHSTSERTTCWRAVLSIASVVDKRVSIFESIVWGVNFVKYGTGLNTAYRPRVATDLEVKGHLRLLNMGRGKTKTFKNGGWTFRQAPTNY